MFNIKNDMSDLGVIFQILWTHDFSFENKINDIAKNETIKDLSFISLSYACEKRINLCWCKKTYYSYVMLNDEIKKEKNKLKLVYKMR